MLHLVAQDDINRLLACPEDTVDMPQTHYGVSLRKAVAIVLEIVRRMPKPRAYLIEPVHRPDRAREMQLWQLGNDLLSDYLNKRKISIVDPASLRELILFCPALLHMLDATDPLWLSMVASETVQQVYIPRDGTNSKRHKQANERALKQKVEVHEWHLTNGLYSRPSQP